MNILSLAIGIVTGLAIGSVIILIIKRQQNSQVAEAGIQAGKMLDEARATAEQTRKEALLEAREIESRAHEYEHETRQRRLELQKTEQRLVKKEENIERKGDLLTAKELDLQNREKKLEAREGEIGTLAADYERLKARAQETLEKVAGMTAEEARQALIEELVAEAKLQAAKDLKLVEDEAREQAEQIAKKYIATALSRYAGEFVAEQVVSVINLPNEEMKGRIIGREGRNIRAFEAATGVDLIIDDTPEAVIVSGFSAVRREVARLALQKLISDGRIHPSRIEEVVKKTEQEVEQLV